ncbi:MAG: hypothetical protein ACI87V_001562, partial [Flavobacteriales bacterium]
MRQWVLFFSMFICVVALRAQTDSTLVQGEERKNSFFGFPVAYWTPETRLGFGA